MNRIIRDRHKSIMDMNYNKHHCKLVSYKMSAMYLGDLFSQRSDAVVTGYRLMRVSFL